MNVVSVYINDEIGQTGGKSEEKEIKKTNVLCSWTHLSKYKEILQCITARFDTFSYHM